MTTEFGKNLNAQSVNVQHSELQRITDESAYRSKCPACPDGFLLVERNQKTLKLARDDRCVVCGQTVHYLDKSINGELFED